MKPDPAFILQKYWGYKDFRPLQREVIDAVMNGEDTLALMPTGGGKSICFQVPALCMEGLCLVITPLISLMKDQVAHLKRKGIPALAIHSGMSRSEVEKAFKNVIYGNFKFLYLSPERLQTSLFLDYLQDTTINLIAVDEAHCISQWGYDFRPAYLRIGELREHLPQVPLLAITATATQTVRKDIQEKLLFRKKNLLLKSFFRENLSYSVFMEDNKLNKIIDILNKVPGSGIIFCRSRKQTKAVAEFLFKAAGISADFYHAGLSPEERNKRQENWIKNKTRIIVCTNAFGMGIDKPDVRTVIHFEVPESLEAYYQQAGRAGRDGKRSYAVLLYNSRELELLQQSIHQHYPPLEKIKEVYRAIVNYLQVPAGSGEGIYYDFDLKDFVKKFHQDILMVTHVLRILEQEEILVFSENIFLPSRICFTVGKKRLYQFEKDNPSLTAMIKCLLRTYAGIFDDYVPVSEKQVAGILKLNEEEVIRLWKKLQYFGLIDYQSRKDRPQICFLQERIIVDHLYLDMKRIDQRKQAYANRIKAIIAYTENKLECRSKVLLSYFDEPESIPCGICDVCIKNKKKEIFSKQPDKLYLQIKMQLENRPSTVQEVLTNYSSTEKEWVLRTIRELLDENQVRLNDTLRLEWTGK